MPRTARLSDDKETLTITIGKKVTVYKISRIPADDRVALIAWRLTKDEHTSHDVSVNEHGASCTCGAFTFRNYHNSPCKHCKALQAVGLLPTKEDFPP